MFYSLQFIYLTNQEPIYKQYYNLSFQVRYILTNYSQIFGLSFKVLTLLSPHILMLLILYTVIPQIDEEQEKQEILFYFHFFSFWLLSFPYINITSSSFLIFLFSRKLLSSFLTGQICWQSIILNCLSENVLIFPPCQKGYFTGYEFKLSHFILSSF